jgi:hypothetical protein
MNEISDLMLKYWWVAPAVSVCSMLCLLANSLLYLETGKEFVDDMFIGPFLIALLIVAKIIRFATFVFAIAQKRRKTALLLALTVVVCFMIFVAWLNVGMKISGW